MVQWWYECGFLSNTLIALLYSCSIGFRFERYMLKSSSHPQEAASVSKTGQQANRQAAGIYLIYFCRNIWKRKKRERERKQETEWKCNQPLRLKGDWERGLIAAWPPLLRSPCIAAAAHLPHSITHPLPCVCVCVHPSVHVSVHSPVWCVIWPWSSTVVCNGCSSLFRVPHPL